MSLIDGIKKAVTSVFARREDPYSSTSIDLGPSYGSRPDRIRTRFADGQTIITSIYTRIAVDVASTDIRHVDLDKQGRYANDRISGLNDCLTLEANIDQNARHFKQDIVTTLFREGVAAVVPTETSDDIRSSSSFDIESLRVGTIVEWRPRHVVVDLYDDRPGMGRRQRVLLPKRNVAIVENPLYDVMNNPNSTLKRLIRKLTLLDKVDEASSSGKLDLIIQLPYVVKTETKKQQAEERMASIETQLKKNQYGIAYTDGTERITQLNRPAENNLLKQIEFLTQQLYSELGMTPAVFNGTANEAEMLNYNNRTIEPIVAAIILEFKRKFLTKTARTQGQSITYFRDPFKLVPISQFADIADRLARNEVVSSNELRGFLGMKPSTDPKADQLVNSNMPQPLEGDTASPAEESEEEPLDGEIIEDDEETTEDGLDEVEKYLDDMIDQLNKELGG